MKVKSYFFLLIFFYLLGCDPVYAVKYSVNIEQKKPKKTKKYYEQSEKFLFSIINGVANDNHLIARNLNKFEESINRVKVYYSIGFELVVKCIEADKYEIELWDFRTSLQSEISQKIETELLNAITENFDKDSIKIKCIIAKSYFY